MKTLIAFSGGLDSTYLLWKLLTETRDEIHCFWMDLSHITYTAPDGHQEPYYHQQSAAEYLVFPAVLQWLNNNVRSVTAEVRLDCKYEPEPADFPKGTSRGWRVIPMLKLAAEIIKKENCYRFVYGKSPENIRTPNQPARDAWYQDWWKRQAPGTLFETPLLTLWHGRPHALKYLPPALLDITLTCNDPKVNSGSYVACMTCDKCQLTSQAKDMLALDMHPDVVLDYLLRRRNAGPYIDSNIPPDKRLGGGVNPSHFPPFTE